MDNIANKGEPREIDGQSVESEYAIEHPLIGKHSQHPDIARAIDLFSESVRYIQAGNEWKAGTLLQEALEADPSLHIHACEALTNLAKNCSPEVEGAIYYWLGIHTQYLEDYLQAETWYAQAVESFHKIGYPKREGRAHCNLGRVKMKHNDPSGMEEFKKAIALNPMDGIAHIDIGTAYYMIDKRELALDEFAEAVWADPERYGPDVAARLHLFTYTWEEDMKEIGQRIAKKQGMDLDKLTASERESSAQAYHYFEIGQGFFQTGRYKEALEQFEKGKLLTNKFPGNYFGISMTAMQMIEVGAIPRDQIPFYLEKAEQNIDLCMQIAPTNPDYQRSKIIIGEYKNKYQVK
jgi:tetratricopeptide (TPR) repeat protein